VEGKEEGGVEEWKRTGVEKCPVGEFRTWWGKKKNRKIARHREIEKKRAKLHEMILLMCLSSTVA
jgi:hypothetical protein